MPTSIERDLAEWRRMLNIPDYVVSEESCTVPKSERKYHENMIPYLKVIIEYHI